MHNNNNNNDNENRALQLIYKKKMFLRAKHISDNCARNFCFICKNNYKKMPKQNNK